MTLVAGPVFGVDAFAPERPDVEAIFALVRPPAWHADALCREHPELDWFPGRGENSRAQKGICAECLVRTDCLEAALKRGEQHGIWGGLSLRERHKARQEQVA